MENTSWERSTHRMNLVLSHYQKNHTPEDYETYKKELGNACLGNASALDAQQERYEEMRREKQTKALISIRQGIVFGLFSAGAITVCNFSGIFAFEPWQIIGLGSVLATTLGLGDYLISTNYLYDTIKQYQLEMECFQSFENLSDEQIRQLVSQIINIPSKTEKKSINTSNQNTQGFVQNNFPTEKSCGSYQKKM